MLDPGQRAAYDRDGSLGIAGIPSPDDTAALVARAAGIAAAAPAEGAVCTTREQERVSGGRSLSSGPPVTCTDPDGVTVATFGHAVHDPELAALAHDVGMAEPVLLQSMYLGKAARSGSEVGSHQDAACTSPRSRAAHSLHLVQAGAHHPDNGLQRPARGLA